ncbi:MAG: helix-turn-helix transcriptional regulator [Chthoniobacteraceae bacterium]
MRLTLAEQLSKLRTDKRLTIRELADRADVSHAVIAGLQSGKRIIGELQARKIGTALGLHGEALEQFILTAIDECTEKLLQESQSYPAELLNLIARQLKQAGIVGESIYGCAVDGDAQHQDVTLWLHGGDKRTLKTELLPA